MGGGGGWLGEGEKKETMEEKKLIVADEGE